MKKLIPTINKILIFCLITCITWTGYTMKASAINLESVAYVMVESYEISTEKIVPGEDFTLKLVLKNYSKNITATDVLVNVTNPDGISPVYGTVSQTWVDQMHPGETATVSFDYTSSLDVTGDYLDFDITMVGGTTNSISLRAPVGSDSPFSVLSVSIPEQLDRNEVASASVTFRVLGEQNVRNVSLEFTIDGETTSRSSVGILTAGMTRTQSISISGTEPGQHEAKLILHYDDETDQSQSVVAGVTILEISEKDAAEPATPSETEQIPVSEERGGNEAILLGAGGVLILCIFAMVLLWIRKRR